MPVSISNNIYAPNARADFYQGTAAIASWLSGLAAGGQGNASAPASNSASTPNVTVSTGANSFNRFRSQVNATTTASSAGTAPQQVPSDGQNASDYQFAVAAYGES